MSLEAISINSAASLATLVSLTLNVVCGIGSLVASSLTSFLKTLMEDLGINLAGAEVILRMAQRMTELQRHVEGLESEIERLRAGRKK